MIKINQFFMSKLSKLDSNPLRIKYARWNKETDVTPEYSEKVRSIITHRSWLLTYGFNRHNKTDSLISNIDDKEHVARN